MVLQSHRWLWEDHCYQGECGAAVDTSREYIRGDRGQKMRLSRRAGIWCLRASYSIAAMNVFSDG